MKHPAKYTDSFLPIFFDLLKNTDCVLDPMAGTGKLALIKDYGYKGAIICNDLEPDWQKGGIFIVNVSNHIRSGKIIDVVNFHKTTLQDLGLLFQEEIKIKTPRMGFGANSKLRVDTESILVFIKDGTEN